jgi:hypothetical protein
VAASGTFVEKVPGRLMTSEMREFLRLYYENPSTNTTEILIKKYSLEKKVVEDILKNVGPPNVIEPRSKFEYPLGIWHNK